MQARQYPFNQNENTKFRENRQKIKIFLAQNPKHKPQAYSITNNQSEPLSTTEAVNNGLLKNTVDEFYRVQQIFHQNMQNIVWAFQNIEKNLPKEYQYLLASLLEPYHSLKKNLFPNPTGDVENDIIHILETINAQNEQFKKSLEAFLNSAANLKLFNNFLQEIEKDALLVNHIKNELVCKSWLNVQSYIDNPFQNLIRYEILLQAIHKCLRENTSSSSLDLLSNINQSLAYLSPELTNINNYKETILLLNKIELVLGFLLEREMPKQEIGNPEQQYAEILKERIEFILRCVKMGKIRILQESQDISSLYRGLINLLEGLSESYDDPNKQLPRRFTETINYVTAIGHSLLKMPFTLFSNAENKKIKNIDPIDDLNAVIKELRDIIEQTEALKTIHANYLSKTSLIRVPIDKGATSL